MCVTIVNCDFIYIYINNLIWSFVKKYAVFSHSNRWIGGANKLTNNNFFHKRHRKYNEHTNNKHIK